MVDNEEQVVEYWRWDEGAWKDPNKDWKDAKVITAGVDVGSVSSQAVIMTDGELFAYGNTRSGYNSRERANNVMKIDGYYRQCWAPAGIDPGQCRLPSSRQAPEAIMINRIERVETDADGVHACRLQRCHAARVQQHSVGADDDHQSEIGGVPGKRYHIRPQQWLAAGEYDHDLITE